MLDGDKEEEEGSEDFSSKAQIMTLMTTDADRIAEFPFYSFVLIGKFMASDFQEAIILICFQIRRLKSLSQCSSFINF